MGVLGAAFKPDSDDVRDSPALDVAAAVQRFGAQVTVYDPEAMDNARRIHPDLKYADSAVEAARDSDVVMLLTEWQEFREADPEVMAKVVTQRNVVDGRNAINARERCVFTLPSLQRIEAAVVATSNPSHTRNKNA